MKKNITKGNKQLLGYALLLSKQTPLPLGIAHLRVVQPKLYAESLKQVVTFEMLNEFEKYFETHHKRMHNMLKNGIEKDDFQMSAKCTLCPAEGMCPLRQELYEDKMQMALTDIPTPPDVKKMDVAKIPLDIRANIYLNKNGIKKFIEKVEESVFSELCAGTKHPLVKLVHNKKKRVWRKDLSVTDISKGLKDLGVKKPTTRKVINITDADKELKDKGVFAHLYEMTADKPTLAPVTDKREEYQQRKEIPSELLD